MDRRRPFDCDVLCCVVMKAYALCLLAYIEVLVDDDKFRLSGEVVCFIRCGVL